MGILGKSFADIRRDLGVTTSLADVRLNGIKKTFSDIRQQLNSGQGLKTSLFGGTRLTNADIESIEKFNSALKNGVPIGQAWQQNMRGCTTQAKKQVVECRNDKQSLDSFIKSQKNATTSTIALTAKTIALNMALSWGISLAIQGLIKVYDNLAHAEEHCKERTDELMSSYNSAISKANDQAKTVKDIANRYEELSKGVDGLGKNVSLTTEEYAEYNDIVNQVADMFPTLISGYTSEGNAILSIKGNVEELRDAYKEAQQEAYNLLIVSGEDGDGNDIVKQYKYLSDNDWWNKQAFGGDDFKTTAKLDVTQLLLDSVSVDDFEKRMTDMIKEHGWSSDVITKYFEDELGFARADYDNFFGFDLVNVTDEDFAKAKKTAKAYVQTYQAEIDSNLHNLDLLANAYLMTNEDYAKLDEQSQAAASKIVNSIDENLASTFENKEDVGEWVIGIVDTLKDNPEIRDSLTGLFTLDTSDLSPDEAKEIVDTYIKAIAQALGEDENELKIRLGFEDTDDLAAKYMNAINAASQKFADNPLNRSGVFSDIQQFFEENSINTKEEIDHWIEVANACETAEEAKKKYLESSPEKATFNTETLTKQIDELQNAYKTVQSAIQEYNKEGYVSVDTYQSLLALGSDYLKYLFDEEGNLRLDEQAIKDVTIARIKELTVQQKQALLDLADTWESEAQAQKDLKAAIDDTTSSYEDQFQVQIKKLKAKWADDENWTPQGIEDAINYLNKEFAGLDKLEKATIDGIIDGLGMTGESAVDTNKKLKDTQSQIADLDKKANLDRIKHKFDTLEQSVEKLNNTMSLLDNTLDLISEDDHIGKIQTTTLQLDLAREKAGLLANEFTELQNTEYDSADAANELATRMKSVADEIADNQKNILEYGKNIAQYYGDALRAVGTLSKTQIDEATNLLDRNIKSLEEGGLIGLNFSLSPVATPQSAIEKQRQENKTLEQELKSHYDVVANMQKIALDMQYQETMADYARQREELVKSLNEIKTTLGNNSTKVQGIESDKNKKVAEAEKKSNQERLAEEKSFSDQSKGVINDLNNWMKNNPIVAPSLDTSAWEGLVSKAEEYAKKVKDAVNGVQNIPDYPANTKASDIAKAAVTEAKKYEGVPYLWGGTTPNGFDCSGLVQYAMKQAGNDIPRVADDQWHDTKGAKITDMNKLQYGDLVFFGSHDYATHVGMYVGDGQMLHAPHTGDVVKYTDIFNSDYYKSRFLGARRYYDGTGSFDYDGVAGETYEPEYLIDKKTGKVTRVASPTPVNTKTTDVVGVKQTRELEKHKYANGTIKVPNGLGRYYTYMNWDAITNMDTEQGRLIKSVGKSYDSSGYGKIGDRYALAMTSTFGKIGDAVDIQLNDGSVIHGVIADEKSQTYTSWDHNPANQWGHDNGQSMVEFVTNWKGGHGNPFGGKGSGVASVSNLGSVFDDSTLAGNVSSIASDVSTIAKADVITRIKDIIDSGSSNSSVAGKEDFEDGLVELIENNLTAGEGTTERLISAFEAMTQTDAEYKEQFKGLIQNLRDSAGTANYGDVRAQLSDSVANYTEAILGEQAKYQTIAIKETFDRAQEARQLALDYYNQRKADNASADELAILAQTISDLDTEIQGYSDQYVSVMSSYTDYLVKGADREMRVYNERISWQDKVNDELQREVDHASSTTEKMSAIDKLTDSYIKKQEILNEKMDAAHQSAEDLRHNAEFSPIFETFDTYAWFDAEGNATAQFERDREALSLSSPELVPLLNRAFELLQKYTQEWQSANEETKQNADLIKDLELDKAQAKVEQYTKNLQRLNEIDDVRKSKQDAITSAMEKQHSLAQSLREEISNINAELDANKHTEQWLDEDTRKLIFNDEDYEEELKTINEIQAKANRLYKNYQRNLANLTETEWYKEAKITDEYNKQMDILNEKLNVSKQEITLKKKELEYNNALKERDTRIIIGGRSVQVANPDTMYNLAKERSLAQSELSNTLLTNRESEQERRSDRISQGINQEILAREKMVELLSKMDDAQIKAYANMLPVIDELEMFGNMLSDINIPWMNAHSRDYREQFADLPDIYKISGYNLGYDYAGGYDVVEDLYASGIISDEIMRAYSKQLESQHDLKRSTDINTAQYPDTYLYGGKHYADEYGIDDESRYQEQLLREQSREYSQLAYEINHGRGTQAQLDRIKELNDNNAKDNKYIANTLDTTLYTVNEDGIVVSDGQKIGLDDDSMQQVGEIVKGAVVTADKYYKSQKGEIAHGNYQKYQSVGEIAHGNYNKYADGTKYAKVGKALTDEEGYEFKLKQMGGKFRELEGGEMIFSHPQSANLFEFSQNPPSYIQEQIAKMNGQMASVVTNTDNRKSEVHNHYDFGGVVVEHPVDADGLVNGLVQKASSRYDVTKNIRI